MILAWLKDNQWAQYVIYGLLAVLALLALYLSGEQQGYLKEHAVFETYKSDLKAAVEADYSQRLEDANKRADASETEKNRILSLYNDKKVADEKTKVVYRCKYPRTALSVYNGD